MTEQELIDMPLHSTSVTDNGFLILRVSNGWIYEFGVNSHCFVPQKETQYPLPKPKEIRGYFGAILDNENDKPPKI